MICNVTSTPDFRNNLKALCKRYKSMKQDFSDGARVITITAIVSVDETDVTLLTIYDKSDRETIKDSELKKILKKNGLL